MTKSDRQQSIDAFLAWVSRLDIAAIEARTNEFIRKMKALDEPKKRAK